jgi:hypothetical protein
LFRRTHILTFHSSAENMRETFITGVNDDNLTQYSPGMNRSIMFFIECKKKSLDVPVFVVCCTQSESMHLRLTIQPLEAHYGT